MHDSKYLFLLNLKGYLKAELLKEVWPLILPLWKQVLLKAELIALSEERDSLRFYGAVTGREAT